MKSATDLTAAGAAKEVRMGKLNATRNRVLRKIQPPEIGKAAPARGERSCIDTGLASGVSVCQCKWTDANLTSPAIAIGLISHSAGQLLHGHTQGTAQGASLSCAPVRLFDDASRTASLSRNDQLEGSVPARRRMRACLSNPLIL